MDDRFLTAAITGTLMLFAYLIPAVMRYLNNKNQREFDIRKELLNEQKRIYQEFMIALQYIVNEQGPDQFLALQEATVKVAMFGDDKTSNACSAYYMDVVRAQQGSRKLLTQEEHQEHQTAVLNSIRQAIGLGPFDYFELVGFRPESKNQNA